MAKPAKILGYATPTPDMSIWHRDVTWARSWALRFLIIAVTVTGWGIGFWIAKTALELR